MSNYRAVGALDAGWFLMETDHSPLHIGCLLCFEGDDAKAVEIFEGWKSIFKASEVEAPFNLIPEKPEINRPYYRWRVSESVSFREHVRHLALPSAKAGRRSLLDTVEWLHSINLDESKPLWEAVVLSGYSNDEFAVYMKMHHSAIDGLGGLNFLESALQTSLHAKHIKPFWKLKASKKKKKPQRSRWEKLQKFGQGWAQSMLEIPPVLSKYIVKKSLGQDVMELPFSSVRSPLNQEIGRARHVETLCLPLDEMKEICANFECTLNDLLLTLAGGGIRALFSKGDMSWKQPLKAIVPVSLRASDDISVGNKLGFALASIGSEIGPAKQRIRVVRHSMNEAKEFLSDLTKNSLTILTTGLDVLFLGLQKVPMLSKKLPPLANLLISNIKGPEKTLALKEGARLKEIYPISVLLDGQAMNISAISYDHQLFICIIAGHKELNNLNRLVTTMQKDFRLLLAASRKRQSKVTKLRSLKKNTTKEAHG